MATYKSSYTGAQIDEAVGQGLEYGVTRETIVLSREYFQKLLEDGYIDESDYNNIQENVNISFTINLFLSKTVNAYGFIEIYNKRTKEAVSGKIMYYANDFNLRFFKPAETDSLFIFLGYDNKSISIEEGLNCRLNDEIEITYTYGNVRANYGV